MNWAETIGMTDVPPALLKSLGMNEITERNFRTNMELSER
jgi:hypothetical protein